MPGAINDFVYCISASNHVQSLGALCRTLNAIAIPIPVHFSTNN